MFRNNQISKFFNVDAPVATGGGGESIAAMMAKHGVKNTTEQLVAQPISVTPENKDQPSTPEVPPVATTTETSQSAEPAKSESPSQPEEPKETPQPQIVVEPPKVPTLQEVLKNHQPDAVLKELGYDDKLVGLVSQIKEVDPKMVAFLDKWQKGEDLTGYLRELTTDYSKMSAEDVMRHQLRKDYPTASQQQLEALFKREVVKAYSLDSEDEEEVAEGRLLLEAKADKHRTTLVESQKEYLFPKPPEPKQTPPDRREEDAKRELEVYKSSVTDNPFTKNIFSTKNMSFGEGEEKFNYPVDPSALTEILFDPDKWAQTMFNEDGSANVEHQMLIALVAKYGKGFLNEYAKHFKSLGGKSVVDSIENASPPAGSTQTSPAEKAPQSVAEAMAKHGRVA